MILLDTDVLIEIFDKKSDKGDEILEKLEGIQDKKIATTTLNYHEILYGLIKYAKKRKEIHALKILDYTKKDAILSSQLEAKLDKEGKKTGRIDAMIASIAINNNSRFITLNKKHYQPLTRHGLKLINL
ncbi:MAG: type II toxin-antitoxin system VapC family toxin [Candidatus Altiarchaeota archaeon]|nr:type II toxin-antitoxin system VapC family toxin [Candidatus Altiarchaeota archaeon]